ncbi:ATP-binding protein [Flavobacterium sp.]|jgi:ATP-dependent DNA helicase RecG|uniref:ATP-binding protein n=1 Tax=Flavobacterium sp. TaxID=239 RepID=UPI0022BD6019|nr:ATP-binding protein [Flavobacterium sp.]MCZ8367953.1 putative DNA binding domain-containing protein [Flavobacterium sp.]
MTIAELKQLKESEDKVEFKEAKNQYAYNSSRKSVLGYTVAFANEKGGYLVFGLEDAHPHTVCGSKAYEGREGQLEQDVYRDTGVRIQTEVLFEGTNRVLVIKIPSRPVGKPLYFNDVPLMRVGDGLDRMSEEMYLSIIQEQEPDFSAKVCEGISIADLDEAAIKKMKESYARKQKNPGFLQLSTEQVLTDLILQENGKLNYAALVLLAKKEVLHAKLPQSKTIWEFRNSEAQIHHDSREVIDEPLFIAIDSIWKLINQPTLNRKYPVQSGAYIFDLYNFNEEVIREAVLNAIAHRDYTITSEVVIKQYPNKIIITNPGGFPKGVTIENILTVSSTPRSRLMTEILEKTGLVERSGQGVDKIFSITLSEGKAEPNYKNSDMFQVSLTLRTEIIDKAFHVFVSQFQNSEKEPKLGVEQIIILCKIRNGIFQNLKSEIVSQLEKSGLIEKVSGHTNRYTLSQEYHALVNDGLKIGKRYLVKEVELILLALQGNALKIGDLEELLKDSLSRNQINYLKMKLMEDEVLKVEGKIKGARYSIADKYADLRGDVLLSAVIAALRGKYE